MNKGLKITALIFFMFASASIVAHTTIFHHHLDDIQPISQCDHAPYHENFEDCALTTIYVNTCKCNQTFLSHNCDFEVLPCFLILFSDYSIPQTADDVSLPFGQKPYLIPCLTEYISQSLGLRAPPSC